MPPKARKARKPKKPVLQKQKQKQSQRVVVNVNQEKAKRRRASKPRPRQQVSYQPIISMSGSVPVPFPYPIQSSGGFTPMTPAPTSLGAPVVLPTFAEEPVRVIGGENVSVPTPMPVNVPTPIPVNVPTPSIINEIAPSLRPPPPTIAPTPIIKPAPPKSIITQPSRGSDKQFIEPPAPPPSISSFLSDISKDTGITSQKIANVLFKKKKSPTPSIQEPQMLSLMNPNPSLGSSAFPSTASSVASNSGGYQDSYSIFSAELANDSNKPRTYQGRPRIEPDPSSADSSIASSSAMSVPTSIPTSTTKADYLFLDDRSIPDDRSISSMSGFNPPSEKSSIKKNPIIAEPKEVVVSKKPEKKKKDPYDIFSDAERSLPPNIIPSEDEASLAIIPRMVSGKKPPKKRTVEELSDTGANIIPQDVAGRRIPLAPIRETKGYQPLAELQSIAESNGIAIKMGNKKKTRTQLIREIYGA